MARAGGPSKLRTQYSARTGGSANCEQTLWHERGRRPIFGTIGRPGKLRTQSFTNRGGGRKLRTESLARAGEIANYECSLWHDRGARQATNRMFGTTAGGAANYDRSLWHEPGGLQTTSAVFGTNEGLGRLRTESLARAGAEQTTNASFGTNGGPGKLRTQTYQAQLPISCISGFPMVTPLAQTCLNLPRLAWTCLDLPRLAQQLVFQDSR